MVTELKIVNHFSLETGDILIQTIMVLKNNDCVRVGRGRGKGQSAEKNIQGQKVTLVNPR